MTARDMLSQRLAKMLTSRQVGVAQPKASEPDPLMDSPAPAEDDEQGAIPDLFANPTKPTQDAKINIGSKARELADRNAFIRRIEGKLADKSISLKPHGLDRPAGELPDNWAELDEQVRRKRQMRPIKELKMGGMPARSEPQVPCEPVQPVNQLAPRASAPLRGLAADLHALELIRRRSAGAQPAVPRAQRPRTEAPHTPVAPLSPMPPTPPVSTAAIKPLVEQDAAVAKFFNTPTHLELQSKAQLDMARFFMDELNVRHFRTRVQTEKARQHTLKPTVFDPALAPLGFDASRAPSPSPAEHSPLFNDIEFEQWVAELERVYPPLYQQEARFEKTPVSQRTQEALKMLPILGRNVTIAALLNSWRLMGELKRGRSMVVQPDFIRLDNQQTFEHELFMGQSGLPGQRNHTLFKPTDGQGYLNNTAIHLYRPRQLLAAHEDAESFFMRVHPLFKRRFSESAFSGWFDQVYAHGLNQVYLIESFVNDTIGRYSGIQKKLLKQAKVVSRELKREYDEGNTDFRQNSAFNMKFYQNHGFLPASSFYEFLQSPVRPNPQWGSAGMPLWQALAAGHEVLWCDIVLEEQPLDLTLLHFLAVFAKNPASAQKLVPLMGVLDLLLRCGDYFTGSVGISRSPHEQALVDKSTALLKAYEQLLTDESLKNNPDPSHRLGAYQIVWNKSNQRTPVDGANLNLQQENQLVDAFSNLEKVLNDSGLWRKELADVIGLGAQPALAHL
jgi:hypothetical protein